MLYSVSNRDFRLALPEDIILSGQYEGKDFSVSVRDLVDLYHKVKETKEKVEALYLAAQFLCQPSRTDTPVVQS